MHFPRTAQLIIWTRHDSDWQLVAGKHVPRVTITAMARRANDDKREPKSNDRTAITVALITGMLAFAGVLVSSFSADISALVFGRPAATPTISDPKGPTEVGTPAGSRKPNRRTTARAPLEPPESLPQEVAVPHLPARISAKGLEDTPAEPTSSLRTAPASCLSNFLQVMGEHRFDVLLARGDSDAFGRRCMRPCLLKASR